MIEELYQKLKITDKAVQYLKKKNKPFATIEHPDYRTSGESVFVEIPIISNKAPKELQKFNKITLDGIDVYVSIAVKMPSDNKVTIDLESILGIKFLKITGFKATSQD
ncbi:CC/Se motif family (seleno)protein [Proteiniclasticum sp. QWL-01]|uniref:CC/Se motif family (seleno)protein n=1 Tax=Proteiniclasticum sp. QWL-01 TaxID=3036945 RepID=UPI00241095CC|nr:CC/Se motif family (seleno)protein [Proteiniclasticum sp. QWL-01]WFF71484.1 CC/Se motif family (seleno)protein [Proteiniclasticum sp. QWL-01]